MKTGMEWIETIKDEGIRAELLCNAIEGVHFNAISYHGDGITYESLADFILYSFTWSASRQQNNYWSAIHKRAERGEKI